ncbi:MAG TPA: site-2 protease family protein [Geobacterales bacterium]|nr:site-2 protease family protein [Geobacterales bacterium]
MVDNQELKEIIEIVNKYVPVLLYETERDRIVVQIGEEILQPENFRKLRYEIQNRGYLILAKPTAAKSGYYFEIFKFNISTSTSRKLPLALFFATGVTIFLSGYFILFPSVLVYSIIYTFAVLCVLGIHELGHYFMAKFYGLKVSLPFFIPGFPFGTFGAIIRLREPFSDRLQAFDVGIAGPLLGLVPSVVFLLVGMNFSTFSTSTSNQGAITFVPFLMQLIFSVYIPQGATLLLHPLAFAAFLGLLVTFLNMTPISQLDGGHVINSLIGSNYVARYILALASFAILVYTQFIAMAFLALFLMFFNIEPLNTVNGLDKKRKMYGLFFLAIWLLLAPWPISNYSLGTLE